MSTQTNAEAEATSRFAIGRTADGHVTITTIGRYGDTVTKTVTPEVAREVAAQILRAAQ